MLTVISALSDVVSMSGTRSALVSLKLSTHCVEHAVYVSRAVRTHGEDANKCWGLEGVMERLETACRTELRPFTHCAKAPSKEPQ